VDGETKVQPRSSFVPRIELGANVAGIVGTVVAIAALVLNL
jgi:hypothetical protein